MAAGLAVTAAALAAAAPRTDQQHGRPGRQGGVPAAASREMVRAPVRIADAAAAGLVRPGDRVDVLAAARVVARGAPVVAVPSSPLGAQDDLAAAGVEGGGIGGGALIVLSVPRATAAALSGAAASSPLAVALR